MSEIVVGIDDSADAVAALRWAVDEAALRNCELVIAHCWQIPVMVGPEMIYVPGPARASVLDDARAAAQRICESVAIDTTGVSYRLELPEGRAGDALVALGKSADLLVVGTRGAGSLREILLGSTSNYCVHHCRCPVVVVRSQR